MTVVPEQEPALQHGARSGDTTAPDATPSSTEQQLRDVVALAIDEHVSDGETRPDLTVWHGEADAVLAALAAAGYNVIPRASLAAYRRAMTALTDEAPRADEGILRRIFEYGLLRVTTSVDDDAPAGSVASLVDVDGALVPLSADELACVTLLDGSAEQTDPQEVAPDA